MLPNANIAWMAAQGSLLAVIALDSLTLAFIAMKFSSRSKQDKFRLEQTGV